MKHFKKVTKEFIKKLLKIDNVSDEDLLLFQRAFISSSVLDIYGPENVKKYFGCSGDYELLEFKGDRNLETIIANYLVDQLEFKKFPSPPGVIWPNMHDDKIVNFLTRCKSRMVKTNALAKYAEICNMGQYICVVSKDTREDDEPNHYESFVKSRTVHSEALMEDVFEAFVGACFHCYGYSVTERFVFDIIIHHADWDTIMFDNNFKDKILRYYTSIGWGHPEYAGISKDEVEPKKFVFTSCVLSPVPVEGFSSEKIVQYASNDLNSRQHIWQKESLPVPLGYTKTGSSGYVAGIGRGRKLRDAEQDASLNAMINFQSLLEF